MSKTAAQEEFDDFLAKNSVDPHNGVHPEDREEVALERELADRDNSDDEEEQYRAAKIDAAMRMQSSYDSRGPLEVKLPPASFDAGRATGVKGVIADARNYENARKTKWSEKMKSARRSVIGLTTSIRSSNDKSDSEHSGAEDEEHFLRQWRESRRRELESEDRSRVRNRRTSPSVRIFGRFEEVDALGYLDAIEKVAQDTTVVVFVYDNEVCVHFIHTSLEPNTILTTYVVGSVLHDRVRYEASGFGQPNNPVCQDPLRGDRVRQRWCTSCSRVSQPRRPLCQLDCYDRYDS